LTDLKILREGGGFIQVAVETRLDILYIYTVVSRGSNLRTKIKWQERFESGHKTKRREALITEAILQPTNITIDEDLTSLRVTGRIIEAKYEVLKGRTIGVDIRLGEEIGLNGEYLKESVVKKLQKDEEYVVVVIDITGYIIASVGDKIEVIEEKYYSTTEILDSKEDLKRIVERLLSILENMKGKGVTIIVGYNTGTKNIAAKLAKIANQIVEGPFEPNIGGVINVLKHLLKKQTLHSGKFLKLMEAFEKLTDPRNIHRIFYGREDVIKAIEDRYATEVYVTVKTIINQNLIEEVIKALEQCMKVEVVDDTTSLGLLINKYGGIVAIGY